MNIEADEVLTQKEEGAEEEKERMKGRRGGGGWDAEIKRKLVQILPRDKSCYMSLQGSLKALPLLYHH